MEFVRKADTGQLLALVEQLSRLSLALGEQQGRTAQAAAVQRAAELLTVEQTRRTHAAYTSVRRLNATREALRTAGSTSTQGSVTQPAFRWPGRPAGPAPASRPGRAR